jgi:hypothetical protein
VIASCFAILPLSFGQGAKRSESEASVSDPDGDHIKERNEWFFRGRIVPGLPTAELRRRAYQAKLQLRARRAMAPPLAGPQVSFSVGSWTPLGPVPLSSDASGNSTQDYHQVAGRATAVVIDPADPSGNTVYVGGAQSGIWKSINAANSVANNVNWAPISDNQATLSVGAIAIQPGNHDPAQTLILAATGEANNSEDSYFGLGILRSADGGSSWTLVPTANNGALSFGGLGGTRLAFSSGQTNTAVAAMAASAEGLEDGALSNATKRGLYTSLDAGQNWTYDALSDPGGATDATSATSVVYNDGANKFFAAVRYHGFYSSPDGINWTRLANQPGGALLSAAACPPQSTSNNYGCPMYRGEIATVPGRNEMYAWYVYISAYGDVADGGIWQSVNGGASWTAISDSGITNCGDGYGCGVQQGTYNLELLAMADGSATDLYAGAINIYKCQVSVVNPTCSATPFINLTHVYGCSPVAAPSHVHPDQHALAGMIPSSGSDSGKALLYFANDGGVYRALDGYTGLTTGTCLGANLFDDLNQNLGSMAQFVSFSQHPSDPNTILGGTQDNGSPATSRATTNLAWTNVLGGDGGYNAIDPIASSNFYASNPDIPPEGLGVQLCGNGIYCNNNSFNFVATSSALDGDDGAFYFPYILDPGSSSAMLIGTCRVWRGPRTGGTFTALSPNFDTLGAATCNGSEVNQVRALAAAGTNDGNGSGTVYATTSGLGPLEGPTQSPAGGRVWVTTNASAGSAAFIDVTNNGPQGNINPNQYPISGVAIDPSDVSGKTAYVTIMGFTGGPGHVWKTTNAGTSWVDFTGNLPDSPANAVLVYGPMSQVFVATDVGVFASPTSGASWTELGPAPSTNQSGFLPNVAVTALGVFNHSGQQLLRASTYGRGLWQFNLVIVPDYSFSVSNSPLTVFAGQSATFSGTMTAVNGYASSVTLSCTTGTTAPPGTCNPSPASLVPANKTPFSVNVGGAAADYSFNLKATGSDSNHVTHTIPLALHVINFGLTTPSPASVNVLRGNTSTPVSFQITAAGSFNQSVTVSCTTSITGATCNLTPGATVNPTAGKPVNMTASVAVPSGTPTGSYPVTIQAATTGAPSPLTTSFTLAVTPNPDFVVTEPSAFPEVIVGGPRVDSAISINSQDGFNGTVTLGCSSAYGAGSCSISPTSVSSYPATATLSIYGNAFSAGGGDSVLVTATSGALSHSLAVPFNVGDYKITGTQTLTAIAGQQVTANLQLTSLYSYAGKINVTCDASALPGATCMLAPANPIAVAAGGSASLVTTISIPSNATGGTYNIGISTKDTNGAPAHSFSISIQVGDYSISSTPSLSGTPGAQVTANLQINSLFAYSGTVSASCDASALSGATCTLAPSNSVTVPSGGAAKLTATINVPNDASAGTYAIHVNAQDATGLLRHGASISLTVGQDFLLISSTDSQTVTAGQTSGPYGLTVRPVGASFSGAVTLACTAGLPAGAQCVFNPPTPVTPGNSPVDVVMNIATKASARSQASGIAHILPPVIWMPAVALVLGMSVAERRKSKRVRRISSGFAVCLGMIALISCAGVSSGGSGGGGGQQTSPVTCHITVTGSSPGTPTDPGQSTTVTLVVN